MTRDDFIAMLDREGWVGVDLDGTLAEWTDQTSAIYIGPPVPAMVDRVKRWMDAGRKIKIVTARMGAGKDGIDLDVQEQVIRTWLNKHIGSRYSNMIEITNQKDMGMLALWDDMAVTVERNSGRPLVKGFEDDDMSINVGSYTKAANSDKVSILCSDGTIFSVDLGEIYMVSISKDGATVGNKRLSHGDRLVSIFWKKSVRADGKPTKCPTSSEEAIRFKSAWEGYRRK
jgi:hypothetical protein